MCSEVNFFSALIFSRNAAISRRLQSKFSSKDGWIDMRDTKTILCGLWKGHCSIYGEYQ